MPKRRAETFDDLVNRLAPSESWEAFAKRAGVTSRQLRLFRTGAAGKRPFRTTIAKLAVALGVDASVVLAAIGASNAAAKG